MAKIVSTSLCRSRRVRMPMSHGRPQKLLRRKHRIASAVRSTLQPRIGSAKNAGTYPGLAFFGQPALVLCFAILLTWRSEFAPRSRLCYTSFMPDFAAPVERLIDQLKHLPGVGPKTAQRLAFHLLTAAPESAL